MSKVTPFLMYSTQLDDALELYEALFPDFEVVSVTRARQGGSVQSAEFVMGGQTFKAFNGGPHFTFAEGVSLYVNCDDQAEVDTFWEKIVDAGGTPTQCGWIKDPFGLSWQIIPRRFAELMGDPDPRKVKAVVDAMMKMQKLEVADLERAYADA